MIFSGLGNNNNMIKLYRSFLPWFVGWVHFPIRAWAECLFLCHFYPTLSICDQVIPCLKIIFLKTISSLVSFLFHFVYLQLGLNRLFFEKPSSWQELQFLCHFRCRFITTSTLVESTILGKVLLCFGKISPPAFLYFLRVS